MGVYWLWASDQGKLTMPITKADERAALVTRWLCHDLATPVATLLTASELMTATGDAEINALITTAIRRLSSRLKLVRMALGSITEMNSQTLQKLLQEGLGDTPLSITLAEGPDAPPSNLIAAAGLLLAELQRTTPLTIDTEGARWTGGKPLAESALAALSGKAENTPRDAMMALVAAQAERNGWALEPQLNGVAFKRIA